jgi:hypothetical protein
VGVVVWSLARLAIVAGHCQTRDRHRLTWKVQHGTNGGLPCRTKPGEIVTGCAYISSVIQFFESPNMAKEIRRMKAHLLSHAPEPAI